MKNKNLLIIFILFIFIIISISIKYQNLLLIKKTERSIKFIHIYNKTNKILHQYIKITFLCIKNHLNDLHILRHTCLLKNYNYFNITPTINTIDIYNEYNGGFNVLIEPKLINLNEIEIVVGIPCNPVEISGRIVARETFMKYTNIDGYNAIYIFFTGLPSNNYPLEYLYEESELFNDIVVFDLINTYYNISLTMMSVYKYILKYINIKYFIRCNLDAIFYPFKMNGLLHQNYDIICDLESTPVNFIKFPQGAFYVFNKRIVELIYNESINKKHPLHKLDDVYYGEVLKDYDNIKIYNTFTTREFRGDCIFCPWVFYDTIIALHPFPPVYLAAIYNKNLNYYNKSI